MKTATAGHVAVEELMALADGELTGTALKAAEEHVQACVACAGEVAAFREQEQALAAWSVEAVPHAVDEAVLARLQAWRAGEARGEQRRSARRVGRAGRGWFWILGGAGAMTAGVLAVLFLMSFGGRSPQPRIAMNKEVPASVAAVSDGEDRSANAVPTPMVPAPGGPIGGLSDLAEKAGAESKMAPMAAPAPPSRAQRVLPAKPVVTEPARPVPAEIEVPMIARTVALTLTVKDVERSREGLENLLRAYGGYAAQMEVNTPDGGVRSLTASLRVPAGAMRGLLAELKGYGKVETETQSGEEVGQQHADLAARLTTSRASEERLRGILKTRAGDVSEVLEVEEEIARVRGEIESMEAEQQGLEHRVSYATVDLTMNEEGQGPAARTVSSRLAAGARVGWNNAIEAVLGLVTFVLEYGLATVLVLGLLGVPAWWMWRRWRKVRARW